MSSPTPVFHPVRELGRGATSTVDLARLEDAFEDRPADTLVAVKRLLPELSDDEAARRALRHEARAACEVRAPGLVRGLFMGKDGRGPFLVMEYVPGDDLGTELERARLLEERDVRQIAVSLAGALDAVHATGRVHGDLKPENVRRDEEGHPVLVDLGFARFHVEGTGATPGTLAYLAPEVVRGQPASPASDVFALGATLYELATGEHPFVPAVQGARDLRGAGASAGGADGHHTVLRAGRLSPPSRHAPELSPFLDHYVARMLSVDPRDRPTARAVARAFERGEESASWKSIVRAGHRLAPSSGENLPLVGREREMDELAAAYDLLAPEDDPHGASGCAVWISGPSGSGKSRLLRELAHRARTSTERPPLFLYARASKRREARPVGTLLYLLRRWLVLPAGLEPGERELELLSRTLPPREADTLVAALGPSGTQLTPYVPAALVEWLASLASSQPLLVCVDDLHLAGDATLSTLGLFARDLPEREAMLVLGLRSDEPVARPAGLANLQSRLHDLAVRTRPVPMFEVELGSLDEEAVLDAVEARFNPSEPRMRIARVLHERSLGNAGLLAEILEGLAQDGDVHPTSPTDPRWRLAIPPDDIPFPGSLADAVEERIGRMAEDDRAWLERLAVLGGNFDEELVGRAFGEGASAALAQLTRDGWLARVGGRYRFARPALREAVYGFIPEDTRGGLHAAISDALESDSDRTGWDRVFQRAFHLRNAGRHRELVDLLAPLLPDMPGLGQPERVFRLSRWAIVASEHAGDRDPEELLGFLETAADAANRLGSRRAEREMLDRMVALPLDLESDPALGARVYLAHGRLAHSRGELGLARGWLKNAAVLAEKAESAELQCDAQRRLSYVHALAGDFDSATLAADQARLVAPDSQRKAFSDLARAHTLALLDHADDALTALDAAQEELGEDEEHGVLGARGTIDMIRARVFRSTGRQGRALGSASRAVRRARQAGDRKLEVEANARLGGLLIDLDRLDEAESHLRDALYLAREIEDRAGEVLARTWLGILMWERDDPGARASIEAAAELAEEIGHRRVVAVALAIQARVSLAAGDEAAALEESGRSAELLERLGAELHDRIVILGSRVRALLAAGREAEARSARRALEREIRTGSRAIVDAGLRRAQRRYAARLLDAVLSPEGPLYPRVDAEG